MRGCLRFVIVRIIHRQAAGGLSEAYSACASDRARIACRVARVTEQRERETGGAAVA